MERGEGECEQAQLQMEIRRLDKAGLEGLAAQDSDGCEVCGSGYGGDGRGEGDGSVCEALWVGWWKGMQRA